MERVVYHLTTPTDWDERDLSGCEPRAAGAQGLVVCARQDFDRFARLLCEDARVWLSPGDLDGASGASMVVVVRLRT
jgi:hypothetical protein